MLKLAKSFFGHVVPGVVRPLHTLWNQVIGFFFLVLAAMPLPTAIKQIHDPSSYPRLILIVPFTLIMGAFGVSSFLKARKITRS